MEKLVRNNLKILFLILVRKSIDILSRNIEALTLPRPHPREEETQFLLFSLFSLSLEEEEGGKRPRGIPD